MIETMATKPEPPEPDSQIQKFRALAREIECDDDEAAFDERLRKIATAPKASKAAPPHRD